MRKLLVEPPKVEVVKVESFITKYRVYIEIAVLLIAILVCWAVIKHYNNQSDKLLLENKTLTVQMKSYRDKDSLNIATIEVFKSDKGKDLLKIKSQDSSILFLQSEVKKYKSQIKEPGSSVTTVTNSTNLHGTTPTTVLPASPVIAGNTNPTFPTYTADKSNDWIKLHIQARHDSTHFDLKVINKYSVVIGYDKKVPFAQVKNFNPYTETTDLRTFQVSVPKAKRFSLGVQVGFGIVGTKFGPYIGVGGNYDLINLW